MCCVCRAGASKQPLALDVRLSAGDWQPGFGSAAVGKEGTGFPCSSLSCLQHCSASRGSTGTSETRVSGVLVRKHKEFCRLPKSG